MRKLELVLFSLLLPFIVVSCSTATDKCTNVSQSRIHQSYTAEYDQEKNKTSVTAQARFGGSSGTTLEMDGKCAFTHNTYSLSKNTFLGTSYDGDGTGLSLDHTFTFTNNDSQTYTNSISLLAIAFASTPTTVSKSGFTVSWTGGGVRANETVYVYIDDNTRTVLDTVSTEGATTLTFDTSKLATLANGTGTVYLKRYQSKSSGLNVADVGGYIAASYITSKATVTIGN